MARSHGPDELLDPRDTSVEVIRGPRQSERPELSREQGQGSEPQEGGRLTPNRAPEPTQPRSAEPREAFEVRGKTYRLRSSEIRTLSELGKFRAVASRDLDEFAYEGDKDRAKADVQNLIRQGLVAEKHKSAPAPYPDEAGASSSHLHEGRSDKSSFPLRLYQTARSPPRCRHIQDVLLRSGKDKAAGWAESPRDS
jgi:hypothetical protein